MMHIPLSVRLMVLLVIAMICTLLLHARLQLAHDHVVSLIAAITLLGAALSLFIIFRKQRQIDLADVAPALLRSTLDALTEGVLLLDNNRRILLANRAFAEIAGTGPDALRGMAITRLGWKYAGNSEADLPWTKSPGAGDQPVVRKMRLSGTPGSAIFLVRCTPLRDARGRSSRMLVTFSDVTRLEEKRDQLDDMLGMLQNSRDEIKQQNEALQILATRDPLTDCLNRRSFFEQYETLFRTAQRDGRPLACIMADIDMFREINDRYGHTRGDEVIRKVAETLRLSLRSSDTICRYGGDEFCIVLPGITLSRASGMAERARIIIEQLSFRGATDASAVSITASFGVSSSELHPESLTQLIRQAQKALYRSKGGGRNRVTAWKPQQGDDTATRQGAFIAGVSSSAIGEPASGVQESATDIHFKLPIDPDTLPGHDSLTGLPNRKQFHSHIVKAIQSCRELQQHASVVMLDLDMFKRINNVLGYDAGDELLRIISTRLSKTLRSTDSITRIDDGKAIPSIYSLGGDEFGILLTGLDCTVVTAQVISRIIDTVTEKIDLQDNEVHLTCSVGASVYPDNGTDADSLLKNACTALYYAKLQGHNSYQFYDESLNQDSSGDPGIAADLSRAVMRNELDLYYLPQVDLCTGRINSVEALVRWHHPRLGMIPPGEFLPVAEETGLMGKLGYQVIATACRHLRQWQDSGYDDTAVSVNLSVTQFHDKGLLENIHGSLAAHAIHPSRLELEITETAIMENIDAASDIIRALHDAGIHISVDDFGTGYSSLNQLRRFPINTVKIDRSFIHDLTTDADDASIVGAIISTAHNMGMQVIAEGVETNDQLAMLRSMQCDAIQGFLFSPPVPHNEVLQLLEQSPDSWLCSGSSGNIAL